MARQNQKRGSSTGSLLVGVSFFALASYWPELTGARPDAAEQLYLGFFQFIGAMASLGGLAGYYKSWRQREKRKQAETASGVFGSAAFATLDDCARAGLLDPRGFYLGLLDGQPLFYSGKAHLLTVAPARQGKGVNVVIPNLLHFQGSVFVTDPKGELAAVTAAHRAERFGQKVYILNPWGMHGLPQHRCNPLQPLIEAANNPALLRGIADEAKAIALQLLPEPEDSRNRYFREGARTILRAVMLHLATRGFAVQDDQLARTLSAALGQRTVKTRNFNLGPFDDDEIGESLSETGRPLMSADEIRLMGADEQLLLIKAALPVRAKRLPVWFVWPWATWLAPNPVEGAYPLALPCLELNYRERSGSHE